MALSRIAPGEAVTTAIQFIDENGIPLDGVAPTVTWKILDPNNKLVASGGASRDLIDGSIFTASFTMPANAIPTTDNTRYMMRWLFTDAELGTYRESERFSVVLTGDDEAMNAGQQKSVVYIPGNAMVDTLLVDKLSPLPTVTYSVINEFGQVVATSVPVAVQAGTQMLYTVTITDPFPTPTGVLGYYMGVWNISGAALLAPEVESHPIYYLSPTMLALSHSLSAMIDKGMLQNVHPFLSWDMPTFIHHILKGFEYVNGSPPGTTGFSPNIALPVGLTHFIEKAAAVSALRAQLLAEGQTNFDFQGLGVQLNVDRTGTLNDLIGQYQGDLERLPDAKKGWIIAGGQSATTGQTINGIIAGGAATSKISVGPYTNYRFEDIDHGYGVGMLITSNRRRR